MKKSDFEKLRDELIDREVSQAVSDQRVLDVMRSIPRHEFVPEELIEHAYKNRPLPIGEDQTISQPLIVGVMTELLDLQETDRVLEVGTGCGYQAAILAALASQVYTIERLSDLQKFATATLKKLGITNVTSKVGDGFEGWKEHAPFDAIIVTAAAPSVPRELVRQLAVGGRLVLPLGVEDQELILITKTADGLQTKECGGVRFVPMTGKIQG